MRRSAGIPARFEALDALRGICALLIVLFHIPVRHALKDTPAFANLQACVDLFFVLSGFVLCHAYGPRRGTVGTGAFLARRIARLWPLHAAVLALLVALEAAKLAFEWTDPSVTVLAQAFSEGRTVPQILTNLAFLQAFGLHPGLSWNGPAWSVAVEFYLSLLLVPLLALPASRRAAACAGLAAAAGLALFAVSPERLFVSTDWGVLRAALGFFLGCLLYALRAESGTAPSLMGRLEAASLAVLIACGLCIGPGAGQYLFPFACACVVLVFSYGQGPVSRAFRRPALQRLGLWSYSVYMVHAALFQFAKSAATYLGSRTGLELTTWHNGEKLVILGSPSAAVLPALALCLVLVVPVAALTYRFVERPGIDLFGRLLSRRLAAPPLAGAVPAT